MNVIKKCCFCGKNIDINDHSIPAKWFGKYLGDQLVHVICCDCIKKNRKEWKEKKI